MNQIKQSNQIDQIRLYIIKILQNLVQYWDKAESLILLVKSEYVDDKFLKNLLSMMQETAKKITDKTASSQFKKAIDSVHRLQEREMKEYIKESQEADDLLNSI